jgi:hypothetical protein
MNSVAGMSGDAVARPGRGTADAKPLLRLSAEAHQFEHGSAVRRQRLGRYDLALLRLVADIGAQRPAVGRNDRQLFDRDRPERRLAQRVHIGDPAGVDTAGCQVFEGCYRAGNAGFRQRHVPPRRQIKLLPALTLDQTIQPNVQRRHRRSCQDHADANRCEQLAPRRHLNPTHNCQRRLNERR